MLSSRYNLLGLLRQLQSDGPNVRETGICDNINDMASDAGLDITDCSDIFDELGLNAGYPVPSPDPNESAFRAFINQDDMWDDSEYGKARWALLDQMITHLKKELTC